VKGGGQREGYGGEEWRDLGEGAARAVDLTRREEERGEGERWRGVGKGLRRMMGEGGTEMEKKSEKRRQNVEKRRKKQGEGMATGAYICELYKLSASDRSYLKDNMRFEGKERNGYNLLLITITKDQFFGHISKS
jgi:hypothetical protein